MGCLCAISTNHVLTDQDMTIENQTNKSKTNFWKILKKGVVLLDLFHGLLSFII